MSIERKNARKNAAQKKAQNRRNRALRAALYKEFKGEFGWNIPYRIAEWHTRLTAISKGTA